MTKYLIIAAIIIALIVIELATDKVTVGTRLAALGHFLANEKRKLLTSATLWVSYGMMAWPTVVAELDKDHKWVDYLPAAWHDKSIAGLGALVWLARMRTVLPKAPPAQGG